MPTAALPPSRSAAAAAERLGHEAARALAATAVLLLGLAAALAAWAGLGPDHVLKALLVYALGAALVWRGLARDAARAHPHPRFGTANRITLARLAGMAWLAALLGETLPTTPWHAGWGLIGLATALALLDAVDGAFARREGLASAFGARFDMETDAALTLVLSALVLQAGQAGPWVLAAGLMRYAFVAAAALWPWLAAPLAPSRRRQTVCVVQITTLIVCLGPTVPAPLASALAALSLVLLSASFATDVLHLARQRAAPKPEETAA